MKLYEVTYYTWNTSFSDLVLRKTLSVGFAESDAIDRARNSIDIDSRNFEAHEISEVMGFPIYVGTL